MLRLNFSAHHLLLGSSLAKDCVTSAYCWTNAQTSGACFPISRSDASQTIPVPTKEQFYMKTFFFFFVFFDNGQSLAQVAQAALWGYRLDKVSLHIQTAPTPWCCVGSFPLVPVLILVQINVFSGVWLKVADTFTTRLTVFTGWFNDITNCSNQISSWSSTQVIRIGRPVWEFYQTEVREHVHKSTHTANALVVLLISALPKYWRHRCIYVFASFGSHKYKTIAFDNNWIQWQDMQQHCQSHIGNFRVKFFFFFNVYY